MNGKIIKQDSTVHKELKRLNRRTRYILHERDRGRTIRFVDDCVQDPARSTLIEDFIRARDLHIALNKALNDLPESDYKIISECFFESNKPNLTKLAEKHGVTRQVYTRKRDDILLKLRELVISYYSEF